MKSTKTRLLALMLAVVTLFGLCAPAQASSIADGTQTCTVALGMRNNYLITTAGTTLRAGDYTYTTNDGLTGAAYCIDHGLDYTDKVLPVTGKYTTSPATAGAFANGYPQHSVETFLGLYLAENAVLSGLTEAEFAYATQVAVWATLGQLGVDGTPYTAGREYLNPPTGDAQQTRVFRAAQLILNMAHTWDRVYQTGMYIRVSEGQRDGNVAIAMVGLPDATIIGTAERWQSLHRTVMADEKDKGVKIFARDPKTRQYVLSDAYDVSQTQGAELKQTVFQDGSKEMASALETLLNYSKVPAVVDKDLDEPAYYDEDKRELAINPDFSDSEAFASIAAEVALTRFHNKGYNPDYSWNKYELDAQSVAYILCRRFGVEPLTPKLERLAERFEGMTKDEARAVLDNIQDMSKQIGRGIEKALEEKQRSRSSVRRPAR